jgi:hypothetical protein
MKKVVMLAALILGTTAMVNAQTMQEKPAKETRAEKKAKKATKKAETVKVEAVKSKK